VLQTVKKDVDIYWDLNEVSKHEPDKNKVRKISS